MSTRREAALIRLGDLRVRQGRLEEAAQLLTGLEAHPDAVRALAGLYFARAETARARERARTGHRRAGRSWSPRSAGRRWSARCSRCSSTSTSRRETSTPPPGPRRVCAASPTRKGARTCEPRPPSRRGRCASRAGTEMPRACLHDALEGFVRAQMPMELASTRLAMARSLAESSPEVAIAEAKSALEGFERLEAARHADAAAQMLRSLGAPARTGPKGVGALTKRETEVLQLLGAGLSNPEIADRLYIARKTVEHHVGRVLTKLGLRNRAEAAAFASPGEDPPVDRGPPRCSPAGGLSLLGARVEPSHPAQGSGHDGPGPVRRHRGGGPLRRVPDRDAARPQGLQGARRRPGDVPERHALDPHPPPPGCGGDAALGPARPPRRDGVPPDRHLLVRLRAVHALGRAGHRRRSGGVLPSPHRARQAAGGRGIGGWRRGPRGVHGAGDRRRGRSSRRHPRSRQGRGDRHGARRRGRRGGRTELLRREGGSPRAVQREAAAAQRLLHLLERPADGRPLRRLHPARPWVRGRAHPRRLDARDRGLAVRGVTRPTSTTSRATTSRCSISHPSSPSGYAAPSARPASPARRCRTSSAGPTVRAGPSSATPGTTRTSSLRRGSWTRSATPSSVRPRWTQSFSGARSFDEAMAGYQSTRDEHVLPMFEFTCQLATLEPPPPECSSCSRRRTATRRAMDGFARVNAGVTSPT